MKRSPMKRKPEPPAVRAFRVAIRKRCQGVCEARTSVCWGVVDPLLIHAHHIAGRGSHDPVTNGLGVCSACHFHIHQNPAESYERGWLKHRNYGTDGAA